MFTFTKIKNEVEIFHNNGIFCGTLIMGEDGYYSWWPPKYKGGSWPETFFVEVGSKLRELNKPMDDSLAEYFGDA